MTGENQPRGTIFDQDPALYDAMRPTYPDALFDALASGAQLSPDSRVLEIGAGTGQATVALAGRGYRVIALEPGPAMAEIARRKLSAFPHVTVEVTTFEAWPSPVEPFDAVVAATSFHWLDPGVRISKAAQVLRVGGSLAILSTHHVAGGSDDFFEEAQSCYERFDPSTPPGPRLPREEDVPTSVHEFEGSHGSFGPVAVERVAWEREYTTDGYQRLLMTYSGHRALDRRTLGRLLDCIAHLMETSFGGRITKRYLFELAMAPKAPSISTAAD
ncbi:MAG TPA: class I SAM-dependent methyltransferase [Actinomycetota bacterium]|nr:class I SAM-dependent methyltransferase [Actinomycetota bacterium]